MQFPLARAYMQVLAADMMRYDAARSCSTTAKTCGAEANAAKFVASEASWQPPTSSWTSTAATALSTQYDVERKFRETRVYPGRPGQQQHDPGLPGTTCPGSAEILLNRPSRHDHHNNTQCRY